MTAKHDPAFPILPPEDGTQYMGLTKREYFMSRAPAEPQDWFFPRMDRECPIVPSINAIDDVALKMEVNSCFNYGLDPNTQQAKEWIAERERIEEAQAEWQADFRKQLLIQWPAAWADAVLGAASC